MQNNDLSIIKNDENFSLSQSEIHEAKNIINNINNQNYLNKEISKYFSKIRAKLEDKDDFCYCDKCNNLLLHFNNETLSSLDKMVYSCKCTNNKNTTIPIEDFFKKFIKNKKNKKNEILRLLTCNTCLNKFSYYCQNHGENFCEEKHSNNENLHKDEELLPFVEDNTIGKMNYLLLKFGFGSFSIDDEKDEKTVIFQKFKDLIEILILNRIDYPNYNIFQNINNLYWAVKEYTVYCIKNDKSNPFKQGIEIINNKNELEELKQDLYPYVININLKQSKFYDIIKLNPFENLEELNLRENCIESIKPFLDAKWKNLKTLNLSANKLGDENIEYFENIDLKYLICLILDQNNFTNYDLFIAIAKNKKGSFKKLEDLRIGFNDFKVRKITKNKKKNEKEIRPKKTLEELIIEFKDLDFSTVKKFYINNGVFTQKTAELLLPLLNLKNLTNLNIGCNNLTNLKIIMKKCNWKLLKNLAWEGNYFKSEEDMKIIDEYKN